MPSRTSGHGKRGAYTLESVQLFFYHSISAADIGDLVVTLRPEGSSGNPGMTLATFTNPASIDGELFSNQLDADDAATFTAPSATTLAADTTCFVVVEFDQRKRLWGTFEDRADAHPTTTTWRWCGRAAVRVRG